MTRAQYEAGVIALDTLLTAAFPRLRARARRFRTSRAGILLNAARIFVSKELAHHLAKTPRANQDPLLNA